MAVRGSEAALKSEAAGLGEGGGRENAEHNEG
jgi:hypothetical protein